MRFEDLVRSAGRPKVITVLCDEINGADYRDAIKLVESIRIKTE